MKKGFTIGHVPISSMAMLHFLKKCKLSNHVGDGRDYSASEQTAAWAIACNLHKFETASSRFDNYITTDGKAVHLLMDRTIAIEAGRSSQLTPAQSVQLLYDPKVDKVGVDPGVDRVTTTARLDGSVSAFSSASYYEQAHFNTSRRRIDKWNSDEVSQAATQKLKEVTAETADFDQYCKFLRTYLSVLRPLLQHHTERG
ncbi:hypothetical protein HYH02_015186 [Chlamydomonas schloesseri]|uniref:Uncharacterized protein n=1 Tax=Chlamydomonas schloesseri TaxID=2026947 RepID=A0A835SQX9_9CHLO|nr:hypothetical protein HYH02_015186 [Chlamydomonas schloesseri]|eukprot:KAG2424326.1 hypothetical protein HYH02_015186 [Chlamydomonas schloesseri]